MLEQLTFASYGPLLPISILILLIGVFSYYFVFISAIFEPLVTQPISGPFVALHALAFFFMVSFISLNEFSKQEAAKEILSVEQTSILHFLQMPKIKSIQQDKISPLIKQYLDQSLQDEWINTKNRFASNEVNQTIKSLYDIIFAPNFTCHTNANSQVNCVPLLMGKSYAENLLNLTTARNRRIQIGQLERSHVYWFLCFGLVLVAAITVTAVHRDKKRTALTSLAFFLTSAWLAISIIALNYSPYRGPNSIEPTSLLIIQNLMK